MTDFVNPLVSVYAELMDRLSPLPPVCLLRDIGHPTGQGPTPPGATNGTAPLNTFQIIFEGRSPRAGK